MASLTTSRLNMSKSMDQGQITLGREIPFGEFRSISLPYPNNSISTRKFTMTNFLPQALSQALKTSGYAWLLGVSVIDAVLVTMGEDEDVSTAIVFAFVLILAVIREAFLDFQQATADRNTNSVKCRIWNGKEFIDIPCGKVLCGDLLIVANGESVSADVVLLATEDSEGFCYVDNALTLGSDEMARKLAVPDIQRFFDGASLERAAATLPKMLGLIRTPAPSPDFQSFTGQLRLNDSPSAVALSLSNFILRGSCVFGSKWVICCAVGTGMDTKVMLNRPQSKQPLSKLESVMNVYAIIAAVIVLVLGLANLIGFLLVKTPFDQSAVLVAIESVFLFHRLVPAMLYIVLALIQFLDTFRVNRSTFFHKDATVSHSKACCAYGEIDYIVADKRCAFTSGVPKVHSIFFGDKVFNQCSGYADSKHTCVEAVRRRKNKAVLVPDMTNLLNEKRATADPNEHTVTSQSKIVEEVEDCCGFRMLESMLLDGDSEHLIKLFECMVLCNHVAQLDPLKANNKFEEALVMCGDRFGLKLLEVSDETLMLEQRGKRILYRVLASSEYTKSNKRMSLLTGRSDSSHGMLYIKGSIETLGPLLDVDPDHLDRIRSAAIELERTGLVPIILAGKTIEPDELDSVKETLFKARAAVINVVEKIESVFADLEHELRYLGIVCIEDTIAPDTPAGVAKLSKAGVKLWVVSTDSETECLASCMRTGFFDEESYIVPVKDLQDQSECIKQLTILTTEFIYRKPVNSNGQDEYSSMLMTPRTMRMAPSLEKLMGELVTPRRRMTSQEILSVPYDPKTLKFSIVIDGVSFETALQTDQSQQLLAALLFTSKVVCLFSMLPHQKAKVVRFLKNSFSFHPTVLTLADGLSSIPMLKESDLKVSIKTMISKRDLYLYDAKVASLLTLADFLTTNGRMSYRRVLRIALLVVYENTLIVTTIVLYAGFSGFTASSPIDYQSVWAITLIATKPVMAYLGLFSEDLAREDSLQNPELYRWQAKPVTLKRCMWNIALAVVQGGILFALTYVGLDAVQCPSGRTENRLILSAVLSVTLYLSIIAHIINLSDDLRSMFLWLFVLIGFIAFCLEMILFNFLSEDMFGFIEMAFQCPICVIKMLVNPVCVGMVSYAFQTYGELFGEKIQQYVQHVQTVDNTLSLFSNDLSKVWTPSKIITTPKSGELFERNSVLRTFKIGSLEENYKASILPELLKYIRLVFLILTLISCVCTAISMNQGYSPQYDSLRLLFVCFCACLVGFSFTTVFKKCYAQVTLLCLYVFALAFGIYQIVSGNSNAEVAISIPVFAYLSFHVSLVHVIILNIGSATAFIIISVFNVLLPATDVAKGLVLLLILALAVGAVTFTTAIAGYFIDEVNRTEFRMLTTKQIELEKADNVLKYLLPDFVRARVKEGVRFIAEMQPRVHILFCEICKFDHMIKDFEPVEVITLLNNIYKKFDEICEACGVTKIETVGKVYMACVGIKESEQDLSSELPRVSQAQRLLYFAFELLVAVDQFRLADGEPVKVKVGIHSGKVIAGVVGFHKPQFSLVGDTVNTASRMCSTVEEENGIQLSATTYDLVKEVYGVHFDCKVKEIKGKGPMEVYSSWKDMESLSFRGEMEAPDASPDQERPMLRKTTVLGRGMTIGRRESILHTNPELNRAFQIKKSGLHCFKFKNLKFNQETLLLERPVAVTGLVSIFLISLFVLGLDSGEYALGISSIDSVGLDIASSGLLCVTMILSRLMFTRQEFSWTAMVLLGGAIACYESRLMYTGEQQVNFSQVNSMTLLLVLAAVHFTGMRSFQLLPFILLTGIYLVMVSIKEEVLENDLLGVLFLCGMLCIYMVFACYKEVRLEKYFELKQVVQTEIAKTDNLLAYMLPQHVLNNLKLERAITDHLQDTTLLVADIVGFTAWSHDREPTEVIEMLSNMFTQFDRLCLIYKSYKVYTIGDCYVAMGFSGSQENRDPRQECLNIVLMAAEMKKVIDQVNDDHFTNLNMRIGVHTGELIGAVVGTKIVRYDLYGRDVLIAFKMEANSKPGLINVSSASKSFLEAAAPNSFSFQPNRTVDITAIDTQVSCYFVSPVTSPNT